VENIIIKTDRIIMRQFRPDDREVLHRITHEPDIMKYFPSRSAWPIDKVDRYFSYQSAHWQRFRYGHWALTMIKGGRFFGWCGLEFLPDTEETEVGFMLSKKFWGNGYATESATAAVKFGMDQIGLKEIIGLAHPENKSSQRVLEKSGLSLKRRASYFGMEMLRYAIRA